jgi:hypothetical protein
MTDSEVSHAFLLVDDPTFEVRLVLEAHSTGYRLVSLERFARDNFIVAVVTPSRDLAAGLRKTGLWLGATFDMKGLFGIFLTLVWERVVRRRVRNPFRSTRSLFCSEAVVRTLKAAEYPGAGALADEETTPQEILDFLERDQAARVERLERFSRKTPRADRARARELALQPEGAPVS